MAGECIELHSTAFRWAADQGDLDTAAIIVTCAAFLGVMIEQYQPIAWAEQLIEPARAVDYPRLAFLYVMASTCCMAGRIDPVIGDSDAAQTVLGSGYGEVPFGIEGWHGAAYLVVGQPERWAELCRAQLARRHDTHVHIRSCLVNALPC